MVHEDTITQISVGQSDLQHWAVSSFWAIFQHLCPQAVMVIYFYSVRQYLAMAGPAHPCCFQDKQIIKATLTSYLDMCSL